MIPNVGMNMISSFCERALVVVTKAELPFSES